MKEPAPSSTAPSPAAPEDAQAALLHRRRISIRSRVAAAFGFLFLLMAAMSVAAILFLTAVKTRCYFLESMGNYVFEIQQARRFEKNFFLYGSGLADALANTHTAREYLERSAEAVRKVVGDRAFERMRGDLGAYESLLEALVELDGGGEKAAAERGRIEVKLRKTGARIVADAENMVQRERMAMHSMLHVSRVAVIVSLAFMLLFMIYLSSLLIRAVLTPLGRFVRYAERIGRGDYSPIKPVRKYRDEFSDLAMAFNRMMEELKVRQEQLMQSGKMAAVGTLTSGIAHELNNPLNNIGLNTEALIEGFEDYPDERKLELLKQIEVQVERASATVRNLLDFTRKESPLFTRVSVERVLESSARLMANEMKLAGVGLEMEVEEGLPAVRGNPMSLQQVFVNLFLNAVQAMPEGGRISVRARREGAEVRVDVADTGKGIPPEHLDRIFEPFFTTKDPGEGTGLGLSVTYGIIEKHGGRITVESEPGKGTVFTVFLPPAKEEGGAGAAGEERKEG